MSTFTSLGVLRDDAYNDGNTYTGGREDIINTFSIGNKAGIEETNFFIRIKSDDKEDANNIDITDEVYNIAMLWGYPLAFHNSTYAPDVGYLVSKSLAYLV